MPETVSTWLHRYQQFWRNLRRFNFRAKAFLLNGAGWLLSLIILAITVSFFPDASYEFVLFIHLYFFIKFIKELREPLQPPAELLLILLPVLLYLQIGLLNTFHRAQLPVQDPAALVGVVHVLLMGLYFLAFGIILITNSGGRHRSAIGLLLFAIIGASIFKENNAYLGFFFQVFLFIWLLRKTRWLEDLSKIECWIYLPVAFYLFILVKNNNPLEAYAAKPFAQTSLWYAYPYYEYLLFKIYLLAILVKIPAVLIYNHARLSGKLRISALFQSTFPQLIQLVILLLMFFVFISAWQASVLREQLLATVADSQPDSQEMHINLFQFSQNPPAQYHIPGYDAFVMGSQFQDAGVIALERKSMRPLRRLPAKDYFYYRIEKEGPTRVMRFVKIDSAFMKALSRNFVVIAGSHIAARPYYSRTWEDWLFNFDLFRDKEGSRIIPFGPISAKATGRFVAPIESPANRKMDAKLDLNVGVLEDTQITVGRLLTPLYTPGKRKNNYFAFDVTLVPDATFFMSPLFRFVLYMMVVYLLINALLIKRFVQFGSEINNMIVQKFGQLSKGIRQIARGNLDYKVKLGGDDEFVELAEHFNQMGEKLKQSLAEAREKERLAQELEIARRVQLSLLPKTLPRVEGYRIAAHLETATEVGGDFYDLHPLDAQHLLFTIGDVSGKSTSAAFYMAQCISLIRFSRQFTGEPQEIALRLNEYFSGTEIDRQMFVTAIIGMLDIPNNRLTLVRAGHTPPLILSADATRPIQEVQIDGIGIGLTTNKAAFANALRAHSIALEPGDTLVLYTDGVIEASRPRDNLDHAAATKPENVEFYGETRLKELLSTLRGRSAEAILQALQNDLETFYAGNPLADDYTLMIIQNDRARAKN